MLIDDVNPTTLTGVKRLAAEIRKERGIKHSAALELASRAAGRANFRHAQRTLPTHGLQSKQFYVLLTVYWYDEKQQHRVGRETLKIELSKPVFSIFGKYLLKNARGFGRLRMVADDHFVADVVVRSQTDARESICSAERSLRFMERTGLLPSRDYQKAYPAASSKEKLPSSDHPTYWVDPASGQFILVDEPYSRAPDEARRAEWSVQTGWRVFKTAWPGMYNPYNCDLYVASDSRSGYDLEGLVAKIDAMPAPMLQTDWAGESSPSWETFFSPMAVTRQDQRRARCRGTVYPNASATSVPYSYRPGSLRRRPAGDMALKEHIEVGRMIKAVLTSEYGSFGIDRRMNSLRSTLEDWMGLEREGKHLDNSDFFKIYYGDLEGGLNYKRAAQSRPGLLALLGDLGKKLRSTYPDCAPLRTQIRRIQMSAALVERLIPDPADQNRCAQSRIPIDMMRQG